MTTDTLEPITETPIEETPVHLARCADCEFTVRYRPSASGAGFALLDSDRALGIGEHNRPTCPNGHGEMEIADDRLPIEQAIEQTVEQLDAQRLPFPVPPFNYAGVLQAICDKRRDIARQEKRVDERKDALKAAKDELEELNKGLGRMIDQFERDEQDRLAEIARREARAAACHPEDTNLVRCAWEQAHPDEECPLCKGGGDETARDSSLHVDAVERFIRVQDSDELIDLIGAAGLLVDMAVVNAWSEDDRAVVKAWAEAEIGLGDKPENHARPTILGTAHVAQDAITSEADGDTFQSCRECGARLVSVKTGSGEELNSYPAGTLVGVDCPGAKQPARYQKRRKKAK